MTSLSLNYSSTSPSVVVPGTVPNLIPFEPQHDNYVCLNPSGLPAGTYHIEQIAEDNLNINANIEWALNLSTNDYWVRHCTTVGVNGIAPVWGAWSQVNGGGGGTVTSVFGRVGAVTAQVGDYTSTQVTNLSTVPGADVTTALNNLSAQSGVVSFNGRQGAVLPVAGDYNSTQVTNASAVPGADVSAALNNLNLNKITLGNAVAAGDLLIASGAGDNWTPSIPTLGFPGHISSLNSGNLPSASLTPGGASVEAIGQQGQLDAVGGSSLLRATLGPAGTLSPNFSAMFADVGGYPGFGQAGNLQFAHRVFVPPGLPQATGSNGAYAMAVDNGAIVYFVNTLGNVKLVPSGNPSTLGPLFLDASGMICL